MVSFSENCRDAWSYVKRSNVSILEFELKSASRYSDLSRKIVQCVSHISANWESSCYFLSFLPTVNSSNVGVVYSESCLHTQNPAHSNLIPPSSLANDRRCKPDRMMHCISLTARRYYYYLSTVIIALRRRHPPPWFHQSICLTYVTARRWCEWGLQISV